MSPILPNDGTAFGGGIVFGEMRSQRHGTLLFDILSEGLTRATAVIIKEAAGAKESECERCDNFTGFHVFRSGRRGYSVYLLSDRNL